VFLTLFSATAPALLYLPTSMWVAGLVPPTSDLQRRCTWKYKCRGRQDAGSDWRKCNRIVGTILAM